jgi:hypothetical protein
MQLEDEMEVLDWYIKVFEGGKDTKRIMQDFFNEQ